MEGEILEMETAYTVKAGGFEGPLSLLLDLIEKRKLFVNEISLAEVTSDYINYVKALPSMNMHDVTAFIVVASTLILIKSRSLLPNLNLTPDEEEKIVDLEARLRLYQVIKDASVFVKERFGKQLIYLSPERSWNEPIFSPDPALNLMNLYNAGQDVLARIPKKEILPEVNIKKVVSIEEMISDLTERIQTAMNMSFKDFAKHPNPENAKEEKVYMIVSFLAMLELVRGGILDVLQENTFDDMKILKLEQI